MDSLRGWFQVRRVALLGALLSLILLAAAGLALLGIHRDRLIATARASVISSISPKADVLTEAVNHRLSLVLALRAFILLDSSQDRLDAEFQPFAADLYAAVAGLRNLTLAPNGTHAYVYPLQGNEDVLGHNLMTDARAEVREDVACAIDTGSITLSGPYELRQGGLGLVARLAVYEGEEFWGLATAVLDVPPLLSDAGLDRPDLGLAYALMDDSGAVFAGDASVLRQDPVLVDVVLPESKWRLAAVPFDGWDAVVRESLQEAQFAGAVVAMLLSGLVYLLIGREERVLDTAQDLADDFAAAQYRYQGLFLREAASWPAQLAEMASVDALRIAVAYLILAGIWILLSDRLLVGLGLSATLLSQIQTLKGGMFVAVTASLLFFAVRRRLIQMHQSMALATASEKKYRLLAENTMDVIWQMDLDFTLTYINSASKALLGYAPDEIAGMSLEVFTSDEDRYHLQSWLSETLATREHSRGAQFNCKLRHRDGEMIPVEARSSIIVDDDGTPVAVQCLVRDTRERDKAERERTQLLARIQEQALLVEQIIDTVPDGVLLLDEGHRPMTMNPAAEQILNQLTERGADDLNSLEFLGDRSLSEVLTSPPQGLWHEVRAGGQVFEVVARPMVEPLVSDGRPEGRWVLVLHDATSEREVRTRIEAQARLSALGQMAAGIAHDFNNILAVVMLYTQMALREPGMENATHERLQVVLEQAERATALVQQILDFGRRTAVERRETDLVELLEKETALMQRTLPESMVVAFSHEDGPCLVNADPRRLQQAIMNLAVNARDAMSGEGELRIAVSMVQVDKGTTPPVQGLAEGRWAMITVEDTGEGIPEAVLPRIYEPFFTTKKPGKGSGLGLAQVYGIVQQHDGQIGVASEVGKGTCFTICLPAAETQNVGDLVVDSVTMPQGHGELVLLVEDHAATRIALVDSLELLNYRVVVAGDGSEALAMLDDATYEVDIVLSDYVMPEVNGRELFFALKKHGFSMPMVILTGHPVTAELDDLLSAGLAGWLPKPPDLTQLAQLLAKAAGQ